METKSTEPGVPIIEMSGVMVGSLQDQDTQVLEDVNWSVAANEYWVVGGMHGAGKSDLMLMTAGLMPPQAGQYRFMGHDMPIYSDELLPERLRLGFVFESGQLLHNLTVSENLTLPLRYHRSLKREQIAERVHAMMEMTDLASVADSTPGTLGRNWQKRVGMARALMLEPEVLLLDNPLSGMDLHHTIWWLNFLGELSAGKNKLLGERRMTLVATAEDLRPWKNQGTHFAVVQKKRFMVLGERAVLAGHAEPLVKELLMDPMAGI